MASDFHLLAKRRLLVVTGKGGAGKSLLSLAIAHRLSTLGKKVWLVELGRKRDAEFTRLPELVGRSKLGHKPTEVKLPGSEQKISVSVLSPAESLAEYVDLMLPTGGLAGVLLNNKITASFLEVVPGLPDLVQLGKLWHSLTHEKNGPENKPDIVVLDSPATGHSVSLLNAPMNFKRITRIGPVYKDASKMVEFLADPAQTGIVLAALPEEMAIRETLDLQKILSRDFPRPLVFVNKCFPVLKKHKAESESLVWKAYEYAYRRGKREAESAEALEGAQRIPFFFPEPGADPLYLRISGSLELANGESLA
jgi:anion-transporting  ArsA/GET3 family ATPase